MDRHQQQQQQQQQQQHPQLSQQETPSRYYKGPKLLLILQELFPNIDCKLEQVVPISSDEALANLASSE